MSDKIHIKVGEVMTRGVCTIAGMATIEEAVESMREKNLSSLVVERRGENDEYGLIELFDIAKNVIAENRALERTNVYEVMTKPVMAVSADMDISYAVRHLVRFRLTRAVVIDDTRSPIGIVTLRDMIYGQIDHGKRVKSEVTDE